MKRKFGLTWRVAVAFSFAVSLLFLVTSPAAAAGSLSYSVTNFQENAATNSGTFDNPVATITLSGETFAAGPFAAGTHYTAANVPAGIAVSVTRTGDTSATVSLTGAATSHTAANSINNLTIIFTNAAFTDGTASDVAGYSRSDLQVTFVSPGSVAWSSTTFTEIAAINDGVFANPVATLSLTNERFTAGPFVPGVQYTVANVPAGLFATVVKTSDTTANVNLLGEAFVHAAGNSINNLTINLTNAAFVSGNAGVIAGSSKSDLRVAFIDPGTITWSSTTFTELLPHNNGSIANELTLTAANEMFTGPDGVRYAEKFQYTVVNIPDGLALTVTKVNATTVTLKMTGNAVNHANANDVSNMGFMFLPFAFASGNPDNGIGNFAKQITVDYSDPGGFSWNGGANFIERLPQNDGSIANSLSFTLSAQRFTVNGALTAGTHFTATNVPPGLTMSMFVDQAAGTGVVSLVGNALNHTVPNSVNNLTIDFLGAAVASGNPALQGDNQVRSVNFTNPGTVAWSGSTFSEKLPDNNGSISTTIRLTLTNEQFAVRNGAMTAGTHFTATNVPAGLTVNIVGNQAATGYETADITITGNANAHAAVNSISNLKIVLLKAAFVSNNANEAIDDWYRDNLGISFTDPGGVGWSGTAFSEALPQNDGSISTVLTLTLTNEKFAVDGSLAGRFTTVNVPNGLAVAIAANQATGTATVTLTGNALYHSAGDSVNNVAIALSNSAFVSGQAGVIANSSKSNLAVNYASPGSVSWGVTTFTEALPANNGGIATVSVMTLNNEQFVINGPLTSGTHFTALNVPAGLTVAITANKAAGTAAVALTGNAVNHAAADSISNLSITINSVAFTGGNPGNGIANRQRNNQVVTFYNPGTIGFRTGWNLISLPRYVRGDPATILAPVLSDVVIVWGNYNPGTGDWESYVPGANNTLAQMQDGRGYWVNMSAVGILDTSAYPEMPAPPTVPPAYGVAPGWNLVGFKSIQPKPAGAYLRTLGEGGWQLMYSFDPDTDQYGRVSPPEDMTPGWGYWLAVSTPGTIFP